MRLSSRRQRPLGDSPLPRKCHIAIAAAIITGCGDFVSIDTFEEIPPLAQLEFSTVQPAGPYDYWELRESIPSSTHTTIASGGTLRRDDIAPDLRITFDATTAVAGFGPFCPPGDCFRYFTTLLGDTVTTWADAQQVAALLGTINNTVEAALLALAHGYHWGPTKEQGAIRPVADGYELVVLKTLSPCSPVRIDRFLLRIAGSGQITILRSEVWRTEPGCI